MTMGPEAKLWKALRPHLDAKGCLSTRIENRHGGGLPDVDVSSPVGVFKIELKVLSKNSVRLSDMQIAYNTLLNCKHGLSFILAEVPGRSRPLQNANPLLQNANLQIPPEGRGPRAGERVGSGPCENVSIFEDQGPSAGDRVGSGRGKSGRVGSGLGPRTSVGSGRVGDRYRLWVGSEALEVGRVGLRHPVLASSDGLADLVAVMIAVCADHHRRLLEKAPGA